MPNRTEQRLLERIHTLQRQYRRCSTQDEDGKQCRATADLTNVRITTEKGNFNSLDLPPYLIVHLCPKHFKFTDEFVRILKDSQISGR